MANRVLDSNRLIKSLRQLRAASTPEDARRLALKLIEDYGTNAIVSPVEIEVLAGVRDPRELDLTQEFLKSFIVIDCRKVPPEDWEEAKRLAQRVVRYDRDVPRPHRKRVREKNPRNEARDLGDCLIVAIARRLHYEISSENSDILRLVGRL